MGTLNAFYLRPTTDTGEIANAVRVKLPKAEVVANAYFYGVTMPPETFKPPERDLMTLSSQLQTDVIWLSFHSVVDAFQFHHWRAGEHLRSLVYGCFTVERTWERAEGKPEP